MGRRVTDHAGKRYGRVQVVRRVEHGNARDGHVLWLCSCDCGTLFEAPKPMRLKSCGCTRTHGQAGIARTGAYRSWKAMNQRCNDPNSSRYPFYGAKGVKVCDSWRSFENFYADIGDRPTPQHVLSRKGDAGDYAPGNVEWTLQADNLREMHERHAA